MSILLLIVVAFALMWLFVVRPQRRRQNEQMSMQDTLHPGDEIVTAGGVYGTVTSVDEEDVRVEIAPGVVVRVARRAIAGVTPEDDEDDEPEEDAEEGGEGDVESEPSAAERS